MFKYVKPNPDFNPKVPRIKCGVRKSETNELQQAIWMFPEQRLNYCRFCDVVVYDNTYKTNRFGMPFGIFTGVNNYGQSVCFAGTIMCDESTESFL